MQRKRRRRREGDSHSFALGWLTTQRYCFSPSLTSRSKDQGRVTPMFSSCPFLLTFLFEGFLWGGGQLTHTLEGTVNLSIQPRISQTLEFPLSLILISVQLPVRSCYRSCVSEMWKWQNPTNLGCESFLRGLVTRSLPFLHLLGPGEFENTNPVLYEAFGIPAAPIRAIAHLVYLN